nr:stalk domain-containing protein [Paenibacillus tuaregi]
MIIGLTVGMLIGSSTLAVAANSKSILASLAKYNIVVNGQVKETVSSQLEYKGTTYLPIRETAGIFGYNTQFDAKSGSISFTTIKDWITLSEFENLNAITIVSTKDEGIYNVTKKGKTLFLIDASKLKDGDETTSVDSDGKVIHIKKSLGAIYLKKADIDKIGLYV